MLAHVCYIIGFNQDSLPQSYWGLAFLVIILAVDIRLFPRYIASPESLKLAAPIGIYSLTISIMVLSAMLCLLRPQWSLSGAIAAILGAWLFFVSDNLLAYNRFVKPTPHSEFLVMSTYHLGQIAIIAGVILIRVFGIGSGGTRDWQLPPIDQAIPPIDQPHNPGRWWD